MGTARNIDLRHYFDATDLTEDAIQVVDAGGLQEVRFGEYLVERQLLTRQQLYRALCTQDLNPGVRFGEIVAALGYLPHRQIDQLLADFDSIPAIEVA